MNIELDNVTENEVEYVEQKHTEKSRFKKFEILLFIGCLLFSFMMWSYANYIDDPIIEKEVSITLELNGGKVSERIFSSTSKINVYGEESVLLGVYEIKIDVDRDEFEGEIYEITVDIADYLPEDVYTHEESITIQIVK